jgi:hypothetical protein
MRAVTFKVLPLNSYALSPMMLSLLETFLEILLWNSFQCRRHIFFFMSSVSWNLRRSKIRGRGWVFHFSNKSLGQKLLDRVCTVRWSIAMVENTNIQVFLYAQPHVTASIFQHNKFGWLFDLVEWVQNEQYPWYRRKEWALPSFVISTRELC